MNGAAPTPLAARLAARIRADGPITVADYMAACLGDPVDGYYRRREPFGADGDFVTAPEVSQMFGELIGLWCVLAWEALGAPARFLLAELGPGRGTLMADLVRAARLRPGFGAAADIHLVETSARLRERQRTALAAVGASAHWHDSVETLPPGPLLLLANEFFDALPVHQFVRAEAGWAERMIGLDEAGRLAFGLRPVSDLSLTAPAGAVLEVSPAATAIAASLAGRIVAEGGAALIIDYGHDGGSGDTLQAVRRHAFDDPLARPGEADITAHVDFAALARAARAAGAAPRPLLAQGAFLAAMGLAERAARLAAGKDPASAEAIGAAAERLAGAAAMGTLFKALAVSSPGLALPVFDSR